MPLLCVHLPASAIIADVSTSLGTSGADTRFEGSATTVGSTLACTNWCCSETDAVATSNWGWSVFAAFPDPIPMPETLGIPSLFCVIASTGAFSFSFTSCSSCFGIDAVTPTWFGSSFVVIFRQTKLFDFVSDPSFACTINNIIDSRILKPLRVVLSVCLQSSCDCVCCMSLLLMLCLDVVRIAQQYL